LPVLDRPNLAYRFVGEALHGTFNDTSRVRLSRVEDVSRVECGQSASGWPPPPPATGRRDRLTAAELLASAEVSGGPVHNAYFLPVGQAAPALHAFQGTVMIPPFTMVRLRHGCPGLPETLSGFIVAFVT